MNNIYNMNNVITLDADHHVDVYMHDLDFSDDLFIYFDNELSYE